MKHSGLFRRISYKEFNDIQVKYLHKPYDLNYYLSRKQHL